MVLRSRRSWLLCICMLTVASGCFDDPKKFAKVEGFVFLNGKPIDGAEVTFAPVSGPAGNVAAKTDENGFFTLRAKIGINKIAVAKFIGAGKPKTPDEFILEMIKNNDMERNKQTRTMVFETSIRIVPQKYESPSTSELSEIVDADSTLNKFKIKMSGDVKAKNRAYTDLSDRRRDDDDPLDDFDFFRRDEREDGKKEDGKKEEKIDGKKSEKKDQKKK